MDAFPEAIIPESKEHWLSLRSQDITSTEVSALFGVSPYITDFELWHRKKNNEIVVIEENQRMKWGTRLQDSIAYGIAEDNGWEVRKVNEYIRHPKFRLGSSFDFFIKEKGQDAGILEVKNVDSLQFKEGWIIDDEELEAPPHIEIQVQHQMAVSNLRYAYIGALIGGNDVKLIKRERDEEIIALIKEKVRRFWTSIELNAQPIPDFEKNAEFIAKLYSNATAGKGIDATGNDKIRELVHIYKMASDNINAQVKIKDAAKAELLTLIGDAEKVLGEEFTISAAMVAPNVISYERSGYRNFRINWRKLRR